MSPTDHVCPATPLWQAAAHGHEAVVKMLLGQNANTNNPDRYGRTLLSMAAANGHEGVVKLLLEWADVNPDLPDKHGQRPFSYGFTI